MKFKPFLSVIALLSTSAFADVDYSRCNYAAGMWSATLDNDGQIRVAPNQKIHNKTTEGKIEKYTIETDLGVYGGPSSITKSEVTLERDDKGQVIKMITGGDKLDKKTIDTYKKFGLHTQATSAIMPFAGMSPTSFALPGNEPLYPVKDKQGKTQFKTLSQLNKEERAQVGLSEDLYKEMTQKWKKDKKSIAKIEKGLKHFQDNSKPTYLLGQEAEFEITDGVCTPKIAAQRLFNTADGSVSKKTTFTKEACEEISKIFAKHQEKLAKCDETNASVNADLYQNNEKIKDLYNTVSFGIGTNGYAYGGMYGGTGSMMGYGMMGQTSQISMLKTNCDAMLGQFSGTVDIPRVETKSSSASKQ